MNYSLDGLTPSAVERPKGLDELSAALASANASGLAVVPWGGGTRIGVGNVPSGYDVALDLTGHTGHLEHVAGDLTVIVDGGVRIGDLNGVLEKEGQRLPFEVHSPGQATVGGSVASNAPGRRQSSTGGIRDWVIGMQIVLADGTVTKSGGRVVKNVQGYDLHRLHTGAYGTLGVISQVAFKLAPTLAVQQTVVAWFDDVRSAREVGLNLVNGLFAPEAISLVSGPLASDVVTAAGEAAPDLQRTDPGNHDGMWTLLVRLGGGVRSIERQVNEVTGAAGASGATGYAVLDGNTAGKAWGLLDGAGSAADVTARVTARTAFALDISEALIQRNLANPTNGPAGVSIICDLGFGALTVLASAVSDEQALSFVNTVVTEVSQSSGSYVIEKCPLAVKQQMDVFSDVGNSIEIMRRIKNQYDPANTLNPGRFAGKI
ncbi:MAG: FAD-binding oxidoreductase [Chloroflexi bacterium]|nr:FAD-binding oxidoreductase [Chloroflexota bacterium]MCI0808777.1 FAD-binding oxidoreductase [Chloroflexota bacterium]MCI0836795.1 FAD-binding oxidoreductase [Chloroflexota bacterium]MCI0850551.1 FAD-binding oxidoreductase [Chloroflexota bacterium]MCI0874851.1 FAD-binding oxidoreductase [Chloroflexota bacterium]